MSKTHDSNKRALKSSIVPDKDVVDCVNSKLLDLKRSISRLKLPSFDSNLGGLNDDGTILFNNNTIVAATIADRIVRKFEFPDAALERKLKESALRGWIEYEQGHLRESAIRFRSEATPRQSTYRAAVHCKKWLRDFEHYVSRAPITFGPGESFISREGDVSIMAKLEPQYFTVSFDALDDVIRLILQNRGLKSVFFDTWKHENLLKKARGESVRSRDHSLIPLDDDNLSKSERYQYAKLLRHFEENGLITYGSRASSVPKDNTKRRFINVEPVGNVIIQKMYGWAIRQCLKNNAGCDLDLGQAYHKRSIQNGHYATIDWSNASDSILTMLVENLIRPSIFKKLDRVRSEFVLIHDAEYGRKVYHSPIKFSSMGNGFTFELLTLVNLSFARVYDNTASVYGDDVIIKNDVAEEFVASMTSVGFQANMKKSFISSPLRESCGAYFLEGYGYIRSYDIKYCHNMMDAIRVMAKLRRIIDQNKFLDHEIMDLITTCYSTLLPTFPNYVYGPLQPGDDLPGWVECENYRQRHKRNKFLRDTYKSNIDLLEALAYEYQRPLGDFCLVMVPEPRPKYRQRVMDIVSYPPLIAAYILAGMRTNMEFRVQSNDRKLNYRILVLDQDGYRMQLLGNCRIRRAY